jgi:hypothetical protein
LRKAKTSTEPPEREALRIFFRAVRRVRLLCEDPARPLRSAVEDAAASAEQLLKRHGVPTRDIV